MYFEQPIVLRDITQSLSPTTGSFVVAGGVGIEKNLNVGGIQRISNDTQSTSTGDGALVVAGGVGIAKDLNVAGDATISGNLYVNGIATYVNTETMNIEDNTLVLNSGPAGSGDAGVLIHRALSDVTLDVAYTTGNVVGTPNATSIELPASASSVDDFYNGAWIKLSDNSIAQIADYNGTTKIATLSTTGNTLTSGTLTSGMGFSLYIRNYLAQYYDESFDEVRFAYVADATDINRDLENFENYADVRLDSLYANSGISTGNLWVSGSSTIANLALDNANLQSATISNMINTNITSTNALITNVDSTNQTNTNLLNTNFTSSNAVVTDLLNTNFTSSNAVVSDLLNTNITSTNAIITNVDSTNQTNTNLLNTNITSTNAIITNVDSTNQTNTNLLNTNFTSSNAVVSDLLNTNITSTNAIITNVDSTNQTNTNLLNTNITSTNAIITNVDSTNQTNTNLLNTNFTSSNAVVSDLLNTNITSTNAIITNIDSTNQTNTNLLSTNVTANSLFVSSGTLMNGTLGVTGASTFYNDLSVTSGSLFVRTDDFAPLVNGTASGTGSILFNGVDVSPSLGDISREREFQANNDVRSESDITGFAFDNSIVRAFDAIVSVAIYYGNNDNNKFAYYNLKGVQKYGGWVLNSSFVGDITGFTFSITPNGQIQYTSTDIPSHNATYVNFRALTTTFKAFVPPV